MFFRSRTNQPDGEDPRVADIGDAGADETARLRTRQLMVWRRSAQEVTRAWNAWVAAERRNRAACYDAFTAALAGEERAAAELELLIYPARAGRCATAIDAQKSGLGAR